MMVVAFHVELILAPGLSVLVTVLPKAGFNNFLLATMMSMGMGHIALACHRLVTDKKLSANDLSTEAMMNHVFSVNVWSPLPRVQSIDTTGMGGSSRLEEPLSDSQSVPQSVDDKNSVVYAKTAKQIKFTYFGKVFISTVIVGSMAIVILGSWLRTFIFHFKGLTGFLLGSDADIDYSLITTGTEMAGATGHPDAFNTRWIQAAYFAFGIAMPLGFLALLLFMWIVPTTLNHCRQLVILAEVANAWNAIDVFVISVAASLLQLHQFALFIIGDSCDEINVILEENFDDQLEGDAVCFDVTSTLKTVRYYVYSI